MWPREPQDPSPAFRGILVVIGLAIALMAIGFCIGVVTR